MKIQKLDIVDKTLTLDNVGPGTVFVFADGRKCNVYMVTSRTSPYIKKDKAKTPIVNLRTGIVSMVDSHAEIDQFLNAGMVFDVASVDNDFVGDDDIDDED